MTKAGFIAIVGRPNAGKSTLLNQVLGAQISIVTPKAQTTRDRILGIYTEEKADRQIVFIDTPGIHKARPGGLNEYMVHEAKEALGSTHVVWYLVDPNSSLELEMPVIDLIQAAQVPTFVLLNKMDAIGSTIQDWKVESTEKALVKYFEDNKIPFQGVKRISAISRTGVQELLDESWKLIPESPFYYPDADQLSDRPTRFFVAEKIREKLLYLLGDEIPYSCAVEIIDFNESTRPPRIEAVIHVERESQKGMVIGQGGKKIKEIGMAARTEIESFLGEKIFLGLKVKFSKDWSENSDELKRMGYQPPRPSRSARKK